MVKGGERLAGLAGVVKYVLHHRRYKTNTTDH